MTARLTNVDDATESRFEGSSPRAMTSRMRSGIIWTGAGLLILGATVVLAAESLIAPGGISLPVWLWPVPLVLGVVAIAIGFGVMVDESSRLQRGDAEAQDAFPDANDDDAVDHETRADWE